MFFRIRRRGVLTVAFLMICAGSVLFVMGDEAGIQIWLPGTQPGQATEPATVQQCGFCHPDQVKEWAGSSMAHSARSPIFNALLAATTKQTLERGFDTPEYCLRCHSPSGWIAGRSHELTVQALFGSDLDGVHCDFCHRSMDPLHPGPGASTSGVVPGYGNGMYVIQHSELPVRGSRGGLPEHCETTVADSFYTSGEYCGVCHEVSNPYFSHNPRSSPPYEQVPMERTYSEWKASWYASQGKTGTCQACHMKAAPGVSAITQVAVYRPDIASHAIVGGNTLALRLTAEHWPGVDRQAIEEGLRATDVLMKSAARVELVAGREGNQVTALVRLTNLAGHKLPTGFPEGRRIWISVKGIDRSGLVVFESGAVDSSGDVIDDAQLKLYEARPGVSPGLAAQLQIPAGHSFLSALNDTFYFDNRIPPRGYSRDAFLARRSAPVGYEYTDGQYWDVVRYTLPTAVVRVDVKVQYQSVSGEFARYLREVNVDNPYDWNSWGEKVYEGWRQWGGPHVIAERSMPVVSGRPELGPFFDADHPLQFSMEQNYPNPFNGETNICFRLTAASDVKVVVFDPAGREVQVLADETFGSGVSTLRFSASHLSSGVYFYRLSVGPSIITKKMVLIK